MLNEAIALLVLLKPVDVDVDNEATALSVELSAVDNDATELLVLLKPVEVEVDNEVTELSTVLCKSHSKIEPDDGVK